MALSVLFFLPVFKEYLETCLVPQFPTLIVCGFCAIAALLSLFSGMILQTIIQKHKQEFEFRLILTEDQWKRKVEQWNEEKSNP